jgi:UDP-2,4-diacetamido-2,4,6-trideoxy-beta-L-altropyranose hydrolase
MRLFIRTEASTQIGLGHFMRCFAIAEDARAHGIEVTFLLNALSLPVLTRLEAIGAVGVEIGGPLGSSADFMAFGAQGLTRNDWLLIDSYSATAGYIALQTQAARVAVLDDLNVLERFDCDLLINPAQAARRSDYERKTTARLLLGADYALIRREFRTNILSHPKDRAIAVMFGGSDPNCLTGGCARQLLSAMKDVEIEVIAGPAHVHTDELRTLAKASPQMRLHVDPPSVARILADTSLVITAAGGSVGEVAAMGRAALVLVVYDNQAAALKACPFPVIDARNGLPDDMGARAKALMDNPLQRSDIARKAHATVDGQGTRRIVEMMFNV